MYITNTACISPQRTFDNSFFEGKIQVYRGDRYTAIEPEYGKLIPAGLLRRMGKAVRMGVGAGLPLMQDADVEGIILGTANGGLEDCLKFLNQIVDYNEGTLTPTNFVQSTPNAVAGNLALMSKTTGYNATHVHNSLAFEAALLDAILLLEEKKIKKLLVGNVEEISDYNHNIDSLSGSFKTGNYTSETLLTSDSPGSVNGEGACMFVIGSEPGRETVARLRDVCQSSYLDGNEVAERCDDFLQRNGLAAEQIDTLILGFSGDNRTDYIYDNLASQLFPASNIYTYKNMVGNYPTASAFAAWLGVQLLGGQQMPAECIYQKSSSEKAKNVLIYNHSKGTQHGFILLDNQF
ncbi:beta-ketoacyl synthase chain length factor [Dyadobacter arcticus]|uniref:3-oxoacyl-(Acyl-carrier-protein) synthase n=1 Tax=Dyadobacter arcticus TaxID=1078754 RepID=A0ABX0UQ81_9BACT|nr:beta-ketoacyl synthase chain length factor [Dyadobacter arcticus]NIJ55117.1 3-oxoacyl-(acyl-carrier-protein) synthase [Dyadobacter arcticus]